MFLIVATFTSLALMSRGCFEYDFQYDYDHLTAALMRIAAVVRTAAVSLWLRLLSLIITSLACKALSSTLNQLSP